MREVVSEQYPVDSEGRVLYSCLTCGRIFHEDEQPCGVGCPTGFEHAVGLANEDIDFEWIEETVYVPESRIEHEIANKDWFAPDDYLVEVDDETHIGDVLFEWRTDTYIADVQMQDARADDDVVLGDVHVNDGYVYLYWDGDEE